MRDYYYFEFIKLILLPTRCEPMIFFWCPNPKPNANTSIIGIPLKKKKNLSK